MHENKNFPFITKIQRMSLHDGPGIRTTVFLKGCSLRCPWCCNPENMEPCGQEYEIDGRKGTYGYHISCDELYQEIIKDKSYYKPAGNFAGTSRQDCLEKLPGGITYSGGEPLLQARKLEPLMSRLADEGIHQAVETSLFAEKDQLETALEYVDLFYADIKIMDMALCSKLLKGSLELFMQNLDRIFSWTGAGKQKKDIVFRMPVIKGYTDSIQNTDRVLALICKYRPLKIELMKGHLLGLDKYKSLKKEGPGEIIPSDLFLKQYAERIRSVSGIHTQIYEI